ncbi:hypothetical protein QBC33DRAFT_552179 [Phialemonium atrogriseum]|uniref:Uncharacterized protein n=1 Tax=Phialemonium atrogriseum TaxID=1093897 RepID=A0AAJ0BPU8_9PEZI|nr:uncharacterized protein QBC33DRAFT_552179 [Phialemonium atrogriseum]KAK1762279.1 hypothetical protein QBC33DRAFT_552179 [Phialemonium atrogriseum]
MESKRIPLPRPIHLHSRRLPTLESEDVEANLASASSNQPSWTPDMRRQWRETSPPSQSTGEESEPTRAISTKGGPRRPLPREAFFQAFGMKTSSQEQEGNSGCVFAAEGNSGFVFAAEDNRWVLLCYGNGGQGTAFPVLLEAFDAETQWRQLRDAWYAKRGGKRLRQLLHALGFGVKKIERVRIYIQGLPLKPDDGLDIAYQILDVTSKVRLLQEENLATNILDITSSWDPDGNSVCSYGPDGIFVDRCPHWDDGRGVCCEALAHFCRCVEIGELQMISRYAKLLQDPKSAVTNSCVFLPWKLFYMERDIEQQLLRCEDAGLSAVEWEALLFTEGWTFNSKSMVFPVLATLFFLVVMASRFLYGDWGTAWTAAGSLAGFIATGLMWIQMASSR